MTSDVPPFGRHFSGVLALTFAALLTGCAPTLKLSVSFSLNLVSLLGLTLMVGIPVDDAIIEVENIEKRIKRSERPYQASLLGADQIGLAVVAYAPTIVVFVPVSFMGGVA